MFGGDRRGPFKWRNLLTTGRWPHGGLRTVHRAIPRLVAAGWLQRADVGRTPNAAAISTPTTVRDRDPSTRAPRTRAIVYGMANRMIPARPFVGVKLDREQLDALDALARERESNRTRLIREAVQLLLDRERHEAA